MICFLLIFWFETSRYFIVANITIVPCTPSVPTNRYLSVYTGIQTLFLVNYVYRNSQCCHWADFSALWVLAAYKITWTRTSLKTNYNAFGSMGFKGWIPTYLCWRRGPEWPALPQQMIGFTECAPAGALFLVDFQSFISAVCPSRVLGTANITLILAHFKNVVQKAWKDPGQIRLQLLGLEFIGSHQNYSFRFF